MAITEKTRADGPTRIHLENTTYNTIKIRVSQSGQAIGVVWEGSSKTQARTIFKFLSKQPEIVWMNLARDHRSH